MIKFLLHDFPVRRELIYFSSEPSLRLGLFSSYMQSFCKKARFGFKRFPKFTKLIDLTNNQFEKSLSKTTLYEIRRAKLEGIKCNSNVDIKAFVSFNNYCNNKCKAVALLTEEKLKLYGDAIIDRVAFIGEDQFLVFHIYIIDTSIKRVRLLFSVSNNHDNTLNSSEKALISRANRLLHYDDMLFFKGQGFLTYDFGGYAYNTKDESLLGINNFKDSFGGVLVEESNYESYFIFILKDFRKLLVEILRKIELK